MTTSLHPEFCYLNLGDEIVYNPTYTSSWGTNDYKLHNHDVVNQNSTSGYTASTATHTVNLGSDKTVTSIKLLNMNFKDFTLEGYDGSWNTLATVTNHTYSFYNFYEAAVEGYYLITSSADYILTSSGLLTVSGNQYSQIRLTVTATQTAGVEKKIAEMYIGVRAFKLSTGRCLEHNVINRDLNRVDQIDWNGIEYSIRSANVNRGGILTFSNLSYTEYQFLYDFVNKGGIYNFFPTGTEIGLEMSSEYSENCNILVQSKGDWNVKPWRQSDKEIVTVEYGETKYVGT